MSKPLGFEKPLGMRDLLPDVMKKQHMIENKLRDCIEKWGYEEIMTPTLEYYDTVGGASATMDVKLFKLLDREGKTVVLRPDMTAPIARVASSLLKEEPLPMRLYYHANVFRTQEKEAGRNAEFIQTGVELIGESDVSADAEMIALAVASLQSVEANNFQIAVGHMGFLEGLLEETVQDAEQQEELKKYLAENNYVGFRERVEALSVSADDKKRLSRIINLRGGKERLEEAIALTTNGRAKKAVQELQELCSALEAYQVMEYVIFDFNLVSSQLDYYTGILFEGYAADLGFPVCSGGRYDTLLAQFGRPAPATGFALKLDRLMQASLLQPEQQGISVLILYHADRKLDAITQANELRQEKGIISVVTRLMNGENEERWINRRKFDQIIRLDGGTHDE